MGHILVDMDKTIATYSGFKGECDIGEPIPKMVERVKNWLASGKEVKIFTARMTDVPFNLDGSPRDVNRVRKAIQAWCLKHIGQVLEVTNVKTFETEQIWDDIAIPLIPNTGMIKTIYPEGY